MDFAGLVSDDLRSGSAVFRDFLFRFVRRRSHSKAAARTLRVYSFFILWIELLIFALSNCDPDMGYTLPGVRSSACPFPIRPAGGWRLGVRAELEQAGQQLWFCCNTIVRRGWNANLSDGVPDSQERQAVCADCPLSARWHVRTSQSETAG